MVVERHLACGAQFPFSHNDALPAFALRDGCVPRPVVACVLVRDSFLHPQAANFSRHVAVKKNEEAYSERSACVGW